MSLKRLVVKDFRKIIEADLELNPGLSLFYGDNGSGKTSLLESAYFLGSARSFKSGKPGTFIRHGSDGCMVRGEVCCDGSLRHLGVCRDLKGQRDISLNGDRCFRASEIARVMPTLVLGPETIDILLGPPETRRRFMNWGVFHVEHTFPALWREANRCLKQRNNVLREGDHSAPPLRAWSVQLADRANKIDAARAEYFASFKSKFYSICAQICDLENVEVEYYRGWPRDSDLLEIYDLNIRSDAKRGFTQNGFHRAELSVTVGNQPALSMCSRGELRAIAWSMILAQGGIKGDQKKLYLVDDLSSELDNKYRKRIGGYLYQSGNQTLLTGLDKKTLLDCCDNGYAQLFHVKHGQIDQQSV